MKAGIYKRRDNGKHIYVAKDRSIRAVELTDCHPTDGSVKVTTSEKEQVVSFPHYTPDMQNLITVSADRVADVPNGTTDHGQALQRYIACETPMPAGVFKTPYGNLVFVGVDHGVEATTTSPSRWLGDTVAYYAASDSIYLQGVTCERYSDVLPEHLGLTPQQLVDLLAQGMPKPGSTREVTPAALPSVEDLRGDVQKGEPNASHSPLGAQAHTASPKTEQEFFEQTRASIADLLERGVIRYVAGGEYEVLDHAAWREFWMSTRPPELPNAGHTAFRPSKAEQWGRGSCSARTSTRTAQSPLLRKPMTADEIRDVFAKVSADAEKFGSVVRVSQPAAQLLLQHQRAEERMDAMVQALVSEGNVVHVTQDEYVNVGIMEESPPCTPLAAADFSKLEERVTALHPALGMPYGITAEKRHGPFLPGRYRKDYAPAEEGTWSERVCVPIAGTHWGVLPNGWRAAALAIERPRAVGKQSARKQRKKGRRVWWDAERNTRVWAPK